MSTATAPPNVVSITKGDSAAHLAEAMEKVIAQGDLSKLSSAERMSYYDSVCRSLGLNPLTRPFQFLNLQGKITMYASRDCADQLRRINGVSVRVTSRDTRGDVLYVEVEAMTPDGRKDFATGAVVVGNLKGEALANAIMKAETKAKRRVTLSICGLGLMDESELDTVRDAKRVEFDEKPAASEIKMPERKTAAAPAEAEVVDAEVVPVQDARLVYVVRDIREHPASSRVGEDGRERKTRAWWSILTESGDEFTTFDTKVVEAAQNSRELDAQVFIDYDEKTGNNGKVYRNATRITAAGEEA